MLKFEIVMKKVCVEHIFNHLQITVVIHMYRCELSLALLEDKRPIKQPHWCFAFHFYLNLLKLCVLVKFL